MNSNDTVKIPEKADSLKKRYFYKLLSNLIMLLIGFITQALIPRGLGPKAYGDYSYITNFFTQITSFLDMGTSIGFYTKLSQRPRESALVCFYLYFSGIASLLIVLFVAVIVTTSSQSTFMPGQELRYIYLGAVWGILNWVVTVINKMADAYGITVSAEIVRTFQKVIGLAIIVCLYSANKLSLENYFYYQFLFFLALCGVFIWMMERKGYSLQNGWRLNASQVKDYINEFYRYSHPLFSYALVALAVGILDRWLLQIYAGSVQQGFFALSYQIGALCFLFTSAMTPLLTREFSIAFGNNDLVKMAALFRRYIPLLYATAAYFSCFIAVQADNVVYIIGGKNYGGALLPVIIMAFYPIHQTYGQLSGSIFFATGQTVLYRNIGVFFMILSLPITYFLIAPERSMGLNAGAAGLALKIVVLQIVAVNVQLYFNARLLKLSVFRFIGHQVLSVGCLMTLASVASAIVARLAILSNNQIATFIAAGVVYTILVAALVMFVPIIAGLKREDIRTTTNYLLIKLFG